MFSAADSALLCRESSLENSVSILVQYFIRGGEMLVQEQLTELLSVFIYFFIEMHLNENQFSSSTQMVMFISILDIMSHIHRLLKCSKYFQVII